ncbi:unnamed protein product [Scytosiphon promiscuus]
MDGLLHEVRQEAWGGLIPAELSMDSSEVTSLQRPLPLYLLLPRMGFLPCVADVISHHFGEVAPDAQRTLWLEDARSGEPLRWHIPVGVLFDLIAGAEGEQPGGFGGGGVKEPRLGEGAASSSSFGGPDLLPWRITVHFQGCPRRQVFPLEKEADIRRHYTNALKQALFLQSGSSRAGMTLAKENQNRLWQALKTNDAKVFHEMDGFLGGAGGAIRLVPVRVLTGGAPPSQLPIPAKRRDGTPFTLRDSLSWFCPDLPWLEVHPSGSDSAFPASGGSGGEEKTGSAAGRERGDAVGLQDMGSGDLSSGVGGPGDGTLYGLGGQERGAIATAEGGGGVERRVAALPWVLVQGVEVPLDAPVIQLWGALRHPDHFLYVVVRKRG